MESLNSSSSSESVNSSLLTIFLLIFGSCVLYLCEGVKLLELKDWGPGMPTTFLLAQWLRCGLVSLRRLLAKRFYRPHKWHRLLSSDDECRTCKEQEEKNNKTQEISDLHLQRCSWVYTRDYERSAMRREKELTHINAENQFSYSLQQLEAYISAETMAGEFSSREKTPELVYNTGPTNLSQRRSSLRVGWCMRSSLTAMVRETHIYTFSA